MLLLVLDESPGDRRGSRHALLEFGQLGFLKLSRQVLAGEELLLFQLGHHAQDGRCQVYTRVKTQGADLRVSSTFLKETCLPPQQT